jgi:aspartate carbamoyltransferase catalytic subunit
MRRRSRGDGGTRKPETGSAAQPFAPGSLLGIEHLAVDDILELLRLARRLQGSPRPLLRGKRVMLVFYEASTRTRSSFEIAAKALGATTVLITASGSSIEKGESLLDTGYTLRALGADVLVFRHPNAGAPHLVAAHLDVPVINAGDGMHEHPSQALLDALTIQNHFDDFGGLKIAIVGDIYHSRVARSNILLLSKFGVEITLCGPEEFVPETAASLAPGIRIVRDLEKAIRGAHVIMLLRVQKERLEGMPIDLGQYIARYQMTMPRMQLAARTAILMHPGPIIRGMELSSEVADSPQSVIQEEVRNGVAVRMAIFARAIRTTGSASRQAR